MSKKTQNTSKTVGKVVKKSQKKTNVVSHRRVVSNIDDATNNITFSNVKRGACSVRMSAGRSLKSRTNSTFTLRGSNGKRHIGSLEGDGVNITYDIQGATNVTIRYNKTKE